MAERHQWQPGRPAGSRNKTTLLLEALLEGEGEKLIRKAVELAKQGDPHALRLCLERLLPARRERTIDLPLPETKTARDVSMALAYVLQAVGEGRITPGEGQTMAGIIESQTRLLEAADHDRRIEELEKAVGQDKGGRR